MGLQVSLDPWANFKLQRLQGLASRHMAPRLFFHQLDEFCCEHKSAQIRRAPNLHDISILAVANMVTFRKSHEN
jgi:hypothetical protein